jgi:hypothetical protein
MATKATTSYLKVRNGAPPKRRTQPQSSWRNLLVPMKPGQWMYVKQSDHMKVSAAASTYVRGCYTMYKVPEGYCFMKTR